MYQPRKVEFSVMDAVDHLSSMAEVDLQIPLEAIVQEKKVAEKIELSNWRDPDQAIQNQSLVKETFRTLHHYLEQLYEKDKDQLKDPETQKGVHAIMVLAGEAAQKMDKYTSLFKGAYGKEGVAHLKEYQDLQQFYLTKIMTKFHEALEKEEAWQAEWQGATEDFVDIQRRGLKDLETVKRDREYELFYVRREDGRPFFNRNLLRHIRLVGEADEIVRDPKVEDPLLTTESLQERGVQESARQMLGMAQLYIDAFYREAMPHKNRQLVACLNKGLMALMMSARIAPVKSGDKTCVNYFGDFHRFLREAMTCAEYKKYLSTPPDSSERLAHTLLNLLHALCCFFFMNVRSRQEVISFIHRLIKRAEERRGEKAKEEKSEKALSMWNTLLNQDENIRYLLKQYPNGPLVKTLGMLREGQVREGFDPLLHQNLPTQMFDLVVDAIHVSCLRLPSPTKQESVNKAEAVEEFQGLLRYLKALPEPHKHLLINLQDRTSWREHARSQVLEDLQKEQEFAQVLSVVTLPKDTAFYYQEEPYANLTQASWFIDQFKEQIESQEACGFSLPMKMEELNPFIHQCLTMIHRLFFAGKEHLERAERLSFIEIFYNFFTLKLIELVNPDSMSFTCKDAVDTSAAATASFFAFLRLLSSSTPWSQEERDFLLWTLYSSALIVRERAVDAQRLNYMVSGLSILHAQLEKEHDAVIKALSTLYKPTMFEKMELNLG